MKKSKIFKILCMFLLITSTLTGCMKSYAVTEDMIPQVIDISAKTDNEAKEKLSEIALAMNMAHLNELIRIDGDNTEKENVKEKDINIIMKTTSVDKDLKIKFVDEDNGRVVTGTEFLVEVTDPDNKTLEYSDHDKDGIIYLKDIAGGKYKISMKELAGFNVSEDVTATVKSQIEYTVIDVVDEVKTESEINVSQEEAVTNGNSDAGKDEVKEDTVEYVESTKQEVVKNEENKNEEVKEETKKVQKVDSFGQLVYSKQKIDKYGSPMYAVILSEPDADHEDKNNDYICDRCKATLEKPHSHTYEKYIIKEATCTEDGKYETKCSCGDVWESGIIEKTGHKDENSDSICDICFENILSGQSNEVEKASVVEVNYNIVQTAAVVDKIIYDTTSAPIYDETSEPVYETITNDSAGTGNTTDEKNVEVKYTGWQTIDGKTYYFDKNGNKVTGTQVINGVQYTFDSNGVRQGTIGIDVSKYQSSINWTKVKNAGIDFVIIRCGYRGYGSGVLVEDPMFASHISGAKAAGLRVGIYFFSQAITEAEAVEEASMAVNLAKKYGINMPIAIDSEYANAGNGRADGLSKADRTKITKAFCNTVANAGYTPMVYASKSWFANHLDVSQFPSSYRIWVAQYADKCTYTGRYDIWQNTSKGTVDGISGYVDMNISSI